MAVNISNLYDSGKFHRTEQYLNRIASGIKKSWETQLQNVSPSWWGRMALSTGLGGGGGILTRKIPGGVEIFYGNKGRYNYMQVIELGRGPYSIKDALLRSPKVRYSKATGERYIIIPMTKNKGGSRVNPKNNDIQSIIRTAGNQIDDTGTRRKKHSTVETVNPFGDTTAVQQGPVKGGGMQYSYMKFMVVSESSKGWMYPAIQAYHIEKGLQKIANDAMSSPWLAKAVEADVKDLLSEFA